jgi:hypothetical protein
LVTLLLLPWNNCPWFHCGTQCRQSHFDMRRITP